MRIQQKLPPPVLLFKDFAGWEVNEVTEYILQSRVRFRSET